MWLWSIFDYLVAVKVMLSSIVTTSDNNRRQTPTIDWSLEQRPRYLVIFSAAKTQMGGRLRKTATICLEYRGSGGKGALHLMWFLEVIRQHFNTLCQWRSSLSGLFSSTLFQPVLLRPPLFSFFFFSSSHTVLYLYIALTRFLTLCLVVSWVTFTPPPQCSPPPPTLLCFMTKSCYSARLPPDSSL